MEHQRLTGLHPCSQSGLFQIHFSFLHPVQICEKTQSWIRILRHFLCNPSLVHTARPHLLINLWHRDGDPVKSSVPFSAARRLASYVIIFVDTEKPLFLWRVIHSFISTSNCGRSAACPQKHRFVLSIFCSWSSCFLHSCIIFFSWRWPKVSLRCSVHMFFAVLHYLQFKRDFTYMKSFSALTSFHNYGRFSRRLRYTIIPFYTKYSNDRTISTVSFIVMGHCSWEHQWMMHCYGGICCWHRYGGIRCGRATGCAALLYGDSSFPQPVSLCSCCQIIAPIISTCPSKMGVVVLQQLQGHIDRWPCSGICLC